jgi:hypothetical protein
MLTGILIRSGRSRNWSFCTAALHHPTTDTTTCIIHGLDQREIAKLKECLLKVPHHPMTVPIILTELKIHYFARLLEKRDKGLEKIECETGMRHGLSEHPHRNGTKEERLARRAIIDFDLKTQQLTGLAGTFAFCDLTFNIASRSIELIEKVSQALHQGPTGQNLPLSLSRRMEYLKGLIIGAQYHRLLLQQRTTAQVQTVYSLIGQKDTAAMMTVAIHTRRDSIDMRIIAAVTLLFLPGTAVAVSHSSFSI